MQTTPTPSATIAAHVRARHMKLFLACVDAQEPTARAAITGAMRASDLELVRESGPTGWLPAEVNASATEVVWSALGPRAREAFFLRLGVADCDSSMLQSTVNGAVRLFGVEPARVLRWMPRAWTQIYRDSTQITVADAGVSSVRITFDALPPCLVRAAGWPGSVACSLGALFNVIGRVGAVAVEGVEPKARRMTLRARWERPESPRST